MLRYRPVWIVALFLLAFVSQFSYAQAPSISADENFCFDPGNPTPISDFIDLIGDDDAAMEGMQIVISQNYDPALDVLTYQNNNGVSGSFNQATGIMTLSGSTTLLVYKDVIEQVFFSTTAPVDAASRSITVALSNLDFLPETGHFYQYVSSAGILWNPAKDAASATSLFGLTGYLATITTQAESEFLIERVAGSAWIGATDEATEGVWRWVTGPEGLENGGAGRRVTSGFVNWNDSEPNNCCGGEDFAHMMDWTNPPGRWNDLNNNSPPPENPYHPTGYMIEFGGMPGEPDVFAEITGTTVLDPLREVSVTGPISICPNLRGVPYTAEDLPGYSYVWTIDGGIIASGQGNHEITVDWGTTNANARVAVRAVSDIACEIEAELPVIVNVQLEPPLPSGPNVVCFVDLPTNQIYSTPVTPGSDYDWKITNGQIISGNGTNAIQVLWDGTGSGTLYFTESTSTATDICDGDSPLLTVDLRDEIVPTLNITHVSCFSGTDGIVLMDNVAGATPITLTWNTNGLGQAITDGVSNLPAGDYSVDINADGCMINVPFSITEPTELIGSMQAMDALCFGTATGTAEAFVTGGTGSYRYVWSISRPQDQAAITGLPMGSYSVDVIDENNCVLTLNFSIDEPPLLVIDSIAATLVTCPEGSDGTLEAFVSGGTPPYTYAWEGSEDISALATGFSKGNHRVTVTDANGCVVTATQDVEEDIPKVFFPNAFSPNNDGENDSFGPTTVCPFIFRMMVYNRWGALVFATESTTNHWDGTIDGLPAPTGKYSFTAAWSITVNNQVFADEQMGTLRLFR